MKPVVLILVALLPSHALAQGAQPDRAARAWAASCAACHGTDGRAAGDVPVLAGRKATELLQALQEFKAGQRGGATVMHQHAKGYSDDELRRIAEYFAAQRAR